MTEPKRMEPPKGSESDGRRFGKVWRPRPGVTFLVFGTHNRSVVAVKPSIEGLVGVDATGRWNHGGADTLSMVVSPEVARQWGAQLIEAADAAEADEAKVREELGQL